MRSAIAFDLIGERQPQALLKSLLTRHSNVLKLLINGSRRHLPLSILSFRLLLGLWIFLIPRQSKDLTFRKTFQQPSPQ
jgi:hypothetical protein